MSSCDRTCSSCPRSHCRSISRKRVSALLRYSGALMPLILSCIQNNTIDNPRPTAQPRYLRWCRSEFSQSILNLIAHIVEGFKNAIGTFFFSQLMPENFCWIEFWRVRLQTNQRDIVRNLQRFRPMRARPVKHHNHMPIWMGFSDLR